MENPNTSVEAWESLTHELGEKFRERAERNDKTGEFVFLNYRELHARQFFSAAIPTEFGGGGLTHRQIGDLIRVLAQYCGSTALAFSMHQHLVGATVWKYRAQGEGAALLQKVVENQLILVSTGAKDWLGSNGEMKKTTGGYLVTARKQFASQAPVGDIAVTSCPWQDEGGDWHVLHFPVPLKADGVRVENDWDTLGMRSTGSMTLVFERVFVPDSAIVLKRTRDEYHPVWNVILTVALPLILSAYVGIAERAYAIVLEAGRQSERNPPQFPFILGKMHNALLSAQTQWEAVFTQARNYAFKPDKGLALKALSHKTNIEKEVKSVVAEAMDALGGRSFYRCHELERLFRDAQASAFHPLPKWEQCRFTGETLLAHANP